MAADRAFQDAIRPYATTLARVMNRQVVSYFCPGYRFELTDTEPRSEVDEANTAVALFQGGVITRNESRIRVGEEVIGPAGDVYVDGSKQENDGVEP